MRKKRLLLALMMAVVTAIGGCGTTNSRAVETTAMEEELSYEDVTSVDELIELVQTKYTEYDDPYCLYALRVPRWGEGEDGKEDQLVVKAIYRNYDGELREEPVAAEAYYYDFKPDYSNITGDPSNEYFWVKDTGYYSRNSILKVVGEQVGPLEEMKYFEPVVLENTFAEDLLGERYSATVDQPEIDEDSTVMTMNAPCNGEIDSFDSFIEDLGHSLVYWNDNRNHDEELEVDSEQEDLFYSVYIEKVKVGTKIEAKNEIVVYVSWYCPGMKETYYLPVYAPQDYIVPVHSDLSKAYMSGLSCSYLETFGYNGAEHGDVDKMAWRTHYWDTSKLLPMVTNLYNGDLDTLPYFEPVKVYEGVFQAGTYRDVDLHPAEW